MSFGPWPSVCVYSYMLKQAMTLVFTTERKQIRKLLSYLIVKKQTQVHQNKRASLKIGKQY